MKINNFIPKSKYPSGKAWTESIRQQLVNHHINGIFDMVIGTNTNITFLFKVVFLIIKFDLSYSFMKYLNHNW